MARELKVLSGGAAQGLVSALKDDFARSGGFDVNGTFGAVGAMRDKLLAGEACDLMILTQALVGELTAQGHLVAGSAVALGVVKTGVAVKAGEPVPDVRNAESLKNALRAATAVYFPDPVKATAGIHFMKVLKTLGIDGELGPRLRAYPNGAAAMREMANSNQRGVMGCTQVTEILYAPGVQLAGLLPREFELATVYSAAVCTEAAEPAAAADFIRLMAADTNAAVRAAGGFENLTPAAS
jgi:molybdate transport system substrate-binding protein